MRGRLMLAWFALAASIAPGNAAEVTREAHGTSDAYAEPGVALAWAVLRGQNEATTQVVVRIVADPRRYAMITASGINPFSQRKQPLLPATPTAGGVDIRAPRAQFGDFPRSEIRFYPTDSAVQAEAPGLIVFYLGVPDTTPEFATEAAINSYLADRIARLGTAAGGKAP